VKLAASLTLIVKENGEPGVAAVPVRVALVVLVDVVSVPQDGSPTAVQVNGCVPVPGLTENVNEYASPAVAAAKVGVAGRIAGTPFTVIL
jgi:hypothetical protein